MKARDVTETYYGRFEGCQTRQTYILVQLLDRIHSDHPYTGNSSTDRDHPFLETGWWESNMCNPLSLSNRVGRRVGEHGIGEHGLGTKRGARPDACTTKTCCAVGRSYPHPTIQPIAARPMSMCRPLAKCGKCTSSFTSSTGCTVTRPPCMQS